MLKLFKLQFVFAAVVALSSILVVPVTVNAGFDDVPEAFKSCLPRITSVTYEPKDGKLKSRDQSATMTVTVQTSGCIIGVEGRDSLWNGHMVAVVEGQSSLDSKGWYIPNREGYIKGSDFKRISTNESSPDYNNYRAVYKRSINVFNERTENEITIRPHMYWGNSVVLIFDRLNFKFTAPPLSGASGNPNAAGSLDAKTNTGAGVADIDTKVSLKGVPNFDEPIGNGLFNPIKFETLPQIVVRAIQILFAVVAGLAVIVIIIAGFRMVAFGSNESEVKKAKEALTWAIIGLVVSLLSFSIVAIIQRVI